jgi:hypothetical protein
MLIPTSERVASSKDGAVRDKQSPAATDPPAPDSVAVVCPLLVIVTVPRVVVTPLLIFASVKTALLVVNVPL